MGAQHDKFGDLHYADKKSCTTGMGGASVNSSFQMQSSQLNLSHLFNNSSAFPGGGSKGGLGRKNIDYLKTLKNPASKAYATVVKKKEPRSTSSSGQRSH